MSLRRASFESILFVDAVMVRPRRPEVCADAMDSLRIWPTMIGLPLLVRKSSLPIFLRVWIDWRRKTKKMDGLYIK